MVKQTPHIRKNKNKNFLAGGGKRIYLVGCVVYYKKEVYQVVSQNKNKTYNLFNSSNRVRIENVKRNELKILGQKNY